MTSTGSRRARSQSRSPASWPYRADLVRIIHADANPAGPGVKLEEVPAAFAGTYPSRFQPVHLGSCGVIVPAEPLALPDPCTIVVRVQPWLLDGRAVTTSRTLSRSMCCRRREPLRHSPPSPGASSIPKHKRSKVATPVLPEGRNRPAYQPILMSKYLI